MFFFVDNPVARQQARIAIAATMIITLIICAFGIFEAAVKKQAHDYGYDHVNAVLYSNPDIDLSRRSIQFARALTGDTDPVYDACVEHYPNEFVSEHMNGLAQTLFGDAAIGWVIDGIDDAFDEFLGERK